VIKHACKQLPETLGEPLGSKHRLYHAIHKDENIQFMDLLKLYEHLQERANQDHKK